MKKRMLICGATGFIGRNLTERFSSHDDLEVIAVYHNRPPFNCTNVKWIKADLTDGKDIERCMKNIDILVQAAATTSGSRDIVSRPFIHVTDNAVMNSLLFRSAFEQKVGHVLFFSCTVMYPSGADRPLTEDDFDASQAIHPRYFGVGWTKIYIEKMCEFYSRIGETKFTVVRHSNIYGPHDKFDLEHSHVFGATITKVMTARDQITVWGTGEEARDLLYVDDLVDFVERAIRKQKKTFELYNCGYGKAVPIKELVNRIVAASDRKLAIEHDLSQPTIKTSLALDCAKASRDLGWRPKTDLGKGIELTLRWWQENVDPATGKQTL